MTSSKANAFYSHLNSALTITLGLCGFLFNAISNVMRHKVARVLQVMMPSTEYR